MKYKNLGELPNLVIEQKNIFRLVYKHPKENGIYYEDINLTLKINKEIISDDEAIEWMKMTLDNFNRTLRPGEKKRIYFKCYRLKVTHKYKEIKQSKMK